MTKRTARSRSPRGHRSVAVRTLRLEDIHRHMGTGILPLNEKVLSCLHGTEVCRLKAVSASVGAWVEDHQGYVAVDHLELSPKALQQVVHWRPFGFLPRLRSLVLELPPLSGTPTWGLPPVGGLLARTLVQVLPTMRLLEKLRITGGPLALVHGDYDDNLMAKAEDFADSLKGLPLRELTLQVQLLVQQSETTSRGPRYWSRTPFLFGKLLDALGSLAKLEQLRLRSLVCHDDQHYIRLFEALRWGCPRLEIVEVSGDLPHWSWSTPNRSQDEDVANCLMHYFGIGGGLPGPVYHPVTKAYRDWLRTPVLV
eukprot:CAMPEP_0204358460 /NCGR_PEP_ID=MMETSP0469-20131031/36537_1 /ASSEMBLY_ACC=CAM_ASM_000384 /TAXON_ID=2969 /ORGANISM="Oxyrrhis marina" /LENGTH=310 /DNA_ID=CAMNT_0051346335 /DNA_START=28 /DNA_END=960 /DNA_ORIENTATION=+